MKKLLIILALMALLIPASADVIIGFSSAYGRYPLNDYYKHSKSQYIYTAPEIGVPEGGTITHLKWFRNNTGADPNAIGTTEIWLSETELTTLSTWQPEGTLVATISDIDLGSSFGWFTVDIDDFNYSGSNLVVSVRTQYAPFTAPHAYWRFSSTSPDYRSLLGNSNDYNPPTVSPSYERPNITLVGITRTTPPLAVTPVYPLDNATKVDLQGWLIWGTVSGADGYKVYFGTDPSPAYIADIGQELLYSLGYLEYSTVYYWQVIPYNQYGDATDCPVWSFTTREDPTRPLPYSQDFNSGYSLLEIDWEGDMGIDSNHGTNGSNGLSCNLYNNYPVLYAVTPPISPLVTDMQILFDYRYMAFTYDYPGDAHTLSAGDKLEVNNTLILSHVYTKIEPLVYRL